MLGQGVGYVIGLERKHKENVLNGYRARLSVDLCGVFAVNKIPLYDQCKPSDKCLDKNAKCDSDDSRCLCKEGYHDKAGVCGKSQVNVHTRAHFVH